MAGGLASAQMVDLATLERCAAFESQERKLACFEAIIASHNSPAREEREKTPDAAPASDATTSRPAAAVAGPAKHDSMAAKPAGVTNVVPAVNTIESVESSLDSAESQVAVQLATGATNENIEREQPALPDAAETKEVVTALVIDVTQAYDKSLRFHLANGQVWRQTEPGRVQYPRNRDFEVEITRGLLGAYRMRIGEQGRMVKIRRTQ